ncbi:capsid protein [Bodo saltans virus]|uniref:Capsid protein n=1 Tax=Bodo saltans virus TaxID=2024608 RepID=A0A2H4UUG0_9VIRU|nr:capsid protein [Bodo saltans virus]ATZ80571.1 capsid protein [Bodo saltans virus]
MDTAKPGGRPTVQVLRNGDLATQSFLRVTLPDLIPSNLGTTSGKCRAIAWNRRLGHSLIKSVEMQIGGAPIDKHWGVWLDIWYELTHTATQEAGYRKMIGDVDSLTVMNTAGIAGGYNLFIPLQFWFCRNYGLALPLIALQYHDVRFNFELEQTSNLYCYQGAAPTLSALSYTSAGVLIDYVYLDSEERRRFAQVGHEYLIEQLQYPGQSNIVSQSTSANMTSNQSFTLNFNHPCKEFIWAHQLGAFANQPVTCYAGNGDWTAATQTAAVNIAKSMLSLTTTGSYTTAVTFAAASTDPLIAQTINGNVWKFIAVNASSAGSSKTVYVNTTPLTVGTATLGSSLTDVTVEVDFNSTASPVSFSNVFVNSNTLHLEDLSIPLASAFTTTFTDTRVWTAASTDFTVNMPYNYGTRLDGAGNIVSTGNIVLNGHDRFNVREGNYFNYVQPWQHHTRSPADGINVYSFALHPEQHQPTGTANMSRIDSTKLNYKTADPLRYNISTVATLNYTTETVLNVFASNYNVLRVMSGEFSTPETGESGYASILSEVRMN